MAASFGQFAGPSEYLRPGHGSAFKCDKHRRTDMNRRDFLFQGGGGFGALAVSASPAGSSLLPIVPPRPIRWHRSVPTSRRAPRASSSCSWKAGRATSTCSIPNPSSHGFQASAPRRPFAASSRRWGNSSRRCWRRRTWRQHGQAGTWVSDWLPHIVDCVDDMAVIRSCWCDGINHSSGVCQMNTGSTLAGRPSLGSWASYGLGTENQNLPAFVVLLQTAPAT